MFLFYNSIDLVFYYGSTRGLMFKLCLALIKVLYCYWAWAVLLALKPLPNERSHLKSLLFLFLVIVKSTDSWLILYSQSQTSESNAHYI